MEEGKIASDRELFSELFENPIHPLFIHMVPPFVDENQRMFHLQLSGEALWKWRDVCAPTGCPSSKYVVYATARVYRELYGKITDLKKIV